MYTAVGLAILVMDIWGYFAFGAIIRKAAKTSTSLLFSFLLGQYRSEISESSGRLVYRFLNHFLLWYNIHNVRFAILTIPKCAVQWH